ncbi:MAG: alanine--tRNA ligase [bacterium]|nr:alanine--tRNA ligase [bacterium]
MKPQELRKSFISFFEEREHKIVSSSSLLPGDDPTLLFTAAGMVQFKKLWSGEVALPYTRAVSIQKCLRTSDLEKVGKYPRYTTFFEMLGNFSFGDYFKQEAIKWAWEFLTEIVKLPKDKLYVSVFKGDDGLKEDTEASDIWKNEIGLDKSRIYKLGKEDNFWTPVGGRGACGPCSEIYYDTGEEIGCGKPTCGPGCSCNRFMEIWNLVFPQYDSQADGSLKPLKNRGIDTGMGFERLLLVMEGKKSIFELDTFTPIIEEASKICNVKYEQNKTAFNIIADHIRTLTFAIVEGIYPSNIGRGYVLRHVLRRAQGRAYEMGIKQAFMYKLVPAVADLMKEQYPELVARREIIALIVKSEEESFLKTLEQGTIVFNNIVKELKTDEIPGDAIFKLYDTYGFPPDLTYELSEREGKKVDKEGFQKIMESSKEKARAVSKFENVKGTIESFSIGEIDKKSEFIGYNNTETDAKIIFEKGKKWILLDKTPFYAESGGQVGDKGKIFNKDFEFDVEDTQIIEGKRVHIGKFKKETDKTITNEKVKCEVNKQWRKALECNHTATHLLHSSLRKVLGDWVHQEGSLVEAERLRFDFTHFSHLETSEIEKIEDIVNNWIEENIKVEISEVSMEEAIKKGAMAIFTEKYGNIVRMVKIGDVSNELCGGTHLRNTGEMRAFKIISEGSIHTGVRRIEAITGKYAMEWFNKCDREIKGLSAELGVNIEQVKPKVIELMAVEKELKSKLAQIERNGILSLVPEILENKKTINNIGMIVYSVPTAEVNVLRDLADKLRCHKNTAGVIGAIVSEKPFFVSFVSDDLSAKLSAGKISVEIGKLAGGGGGGKNTIAQSGGKAGVNLEEILNKVPEIVQRLLS